MNHDDFDDKNMIIDSDVNREPSPELARISALVTRPPKQKTPSMSKFFFSIYLFGVYVIHEKGL